MEMNMLDDCGSCGSAMLEAGLDAAIEIDWPAVADAIADYMMNRQERKEDGVFYRRQTGYFMENTMWADDLYMSVPFLVRYAKLRSRTDCVDEAVRQFALFRRYLFMPDVSLMSHVYDFKYDTPTYVPWGRGNGWVMFSLAELLTELPKSHASYGDVLSFYLDLSRGVADVQGENGLWHQVLTESDSYEETSCTAMFVYSFARGLRLDLFPQPEPFERAVERGWQALAARSIDNQGNVHGVCVGSRYSFSSDYYKHELPWSMNDTHGIGIVLLAGVETAKLQAARSNKRQEMG
jgi:rhamnogalacturonyl hydrolase YesR